MIKGKWEITPLQPVVTAGWPLKLFPEGFVVRGLASGIRQARLGSGVFQNKVVTCAKLAR